MPQPAIRKWRQLLQIYRDEQDRPYGDILTPTQIQIVDCISKRAFPRIQLILPTQYGKSLAVGLGVLLRVANYKEKWAIVAPTEDKARIIMDYIIEHIFDDPLFEERLEYRGGKEKLKQHKSKLRISFRDAGEVRVFSADATNTKAVKRALMGFGAPNVVLDESGAIPDDLYATAVRMVGGAIDTKTGEEGFILEIGNPLFRNHFLKTWFGTRHKKIYMDAEMALAEGRFSRDFLDEMSDLPGYDWLYMCQFPDANEVLPNGYRRIVSDLVIDDAIIPKSEVKLTYKLDEDGQPFKNKWGFEIVDDEPLLGVDVAGGGNNKTKLILRLPKHNLAMVLRTSDSDDLDEVADMCEEEIRKWNVGDYRIIPDAGGVGHGLPAILRRRGYLPQAALFGENKHPNGKPITKSMLNLRAYMYWEVRKWLLAGGRLVEDDGWQEFKLINYRQNPTLKIQIEPKADMIKRKAEEGEKVDSPDTADGLVLTFVDTSTIVEEDDVDVD